MKATKRNLVLYVITEMVIIASLVIALIIVSSKNIILSDQVYKLTNEIFDYQFGKLEYGDDLQYIIRNYSRSIFECTFPDQKDEQAWGVYEEPIGKKSNFQEKEMGNKFSSKNIFAIATCPTKSQAQDLAKILVILKGHGSKYGTVFD